MSVVPAQDPGKGSSAGDAVVTTFSEAVPLGAIEVTDQQQDPGFVAPPAYLAAPWYIIAKDMGVIFRQLPYLPLAFWPLNLDRGGLLEDM